MDDFPNNSTKAKKEAEQIVDVPIAEEAIIEGVVVSKPSRWRRFRKSFIAGDISSVSDHIFWNLLLPASKDMVLDLGNSFLEMMIYGEKKTTFFRRGSIPNQGLGSTSKINYGQLSTANGPGSQLVSTRQAPIVEPVSRRFSPNDITVASRAQGDEIISRMLNFIEQYNVVTVANLYSIVGVTPDYMDFKWGWKNLDEAGVRRERDSSLMLTLPPPIDLGL